MRTTTIPFAALLALAVVAPACGDDDGGARDAISTRGRFCDVVREVDERFTLADAGEAGDFEATQAVYAAIVDDIERLERSLDQVDAEARDAVADALAGAKAIAEAIADGADEEAAAAAAEDVFANREAPDAEATAWISDNCDVDIAS
jgi:hypothetical protein